MGGYGSGWQGTKRYVVEDGLVLSISNLFRIRVLVPGQRMAGSIRWTHTASGKERASISYESNLQDPDAARLRLFYIAQGEPIDYTIRLTTTRPNYGGRRYWFLCPLVRPDGGPPRRVAKLYFPPGGRYFGCRLCYNLTYESSQEAHKFGRLLGLLAADTGIPPWQVKDLLKGEFRVRGRRSSG